MHPSPHGLESLHYFGRLANTYCRKCHGTHGGTFSFCAYRYCTRYSMRKRYYSNNWLQIKDGMCGHMEDNGQGRVGGGSNQQVIA